MEDYKMDDKNQNLTTMMEEVYINDIIPLNFDGIIDIEEGEATGKIKYDKKAFQSGVEKVSEIAGMYTGLINAGMGENAALALMDYLLTKDETPGIREHEVTLAKITSAKIEGQQI